MVGGSGGAVVAVGQENVLAVAVPVDEQLDPVASGEAVGVSLQGDHFGGVAGGLALVGLGAVVSGGAARELPVERPVAVDVSTDASAAGSDLTVLAPKAVVCLSVGKTIRVDNGQNVKVVLVKQSLDSGIILLVAINELVGEVFDNHGGDPLASVDGAVPVDGRLGAFATATPQVNTEEGTSAVRVTRVDQLGVRWEVGLQVADKLLVVGESVVRVKPSQTRESLKRDIVVALVGSKGALFGDVSTKILMKDGRLEPKLFELGDIASRNGDVKVFAVVKIEWDRRNVGNLLLDRRRVVVCGDTEGLEAIIGDLLLERSHCRGGCQRQDERQGSEELHCQLQTPEAA